MKYVYCLTSDTGCPGRFPPGITGARVYRISYQGLVALVSDVGSEALAATAEQAAIHGEIVNRVWLAGGPVIPCRFGTLFATDIDVLSILKEHYGSFQTSLNQLSGKVEVGVKAIFDKEPLVSFSQDIDERALTPGERYLLEKREAHNAAQGWQQKTESFSRAVNEATASLWLEMKREKEQTDKGLVLNFCYLLERNKLSLFKRAYQRLRKAWPQVKILYSGPWPPYSFARIDLAKCEY